METAFRKALDSHIDHTKTYGASGVAFCMKKQVYEKRLGIKTPQSGRMVMGHLWHEGTLGKVVPMIYPEDRIVRSSVKECPEYSVESEVLIHSPHVYERLVEYKIGEIVIEGHCDVDLPRYNRIIELKTTSHTGPIDPQAFLTQCYIQQANAYAVMLGRAYWELWVIFKDFEDISSEEFVSVINGKANQSSFETYCERVKFIDAAVKDQTIDLTGPEAQWECPQCHFIRLCSRWVKQFEFIKTLLPCKKEIITPDLMKAFELMGEMGQIFFDRSAKVWKVKA